MDFLFNYTSRAKYINVWSTFSLSSPCSKEKAVLRSGHQPQYERWRGGANIPWAACRITLCEGYNVSLNMLPYEHKHTHFHNFFILFLVSTQMMDRFVLIRKLSGSRIVSYANTQTQAQTREKCLHKKLKLHFLFLH